MPLLHLLLAPWFQQHNSDYSLDYNPVPEQGTGLGCGL
jgi:hypothetical protein